MASKFPQTIHKLMDSLDLEHTLFVHMLFMNHYIDSQKYTFRDDWDVDDFCTCYNDMMQNKQKDMYSDDFELDEEGGMWQWYLERLKADNY